MLGSCRLLEISGKCSIPVLGVICAFFETFIDILLLLKGDFKKIFHLLSALLQL